MNNGTVTLKVPLPPAPPVSAPTAVLSADNTEQNSEPTVSAEAEQSGKPGLFVSVWRHLNRSVGRGYRFVLLLSFMLGITGFSLVYMHEQSRRLFSVLLEDFRVMAVIADKTPDNVITSAGDALKSAPGLAELKPVLKNDGLEVLRRTDPDLAKSVTSFGESPIPEYFEMQFTEEGVGSVDAWADSVDKKPIEGISELLYKPSEIKAILQAGFYRRFLALSLSLVSVALVLFAFMAEWSAVGRKHAFPALAESAGWMFSGLIGVGAAIFACWMLIYPLRYLNPTWWFFPSAAWQAGLLVAGVVLGRALYRWKS